MIAPGYLCTRMSTPGGFRPKVVLRKKLAGAALALLPLLLVPAAVNGPQAAATPPSATRVTFWAGEEMEGGLWDDVEDYWAPRDLTAFTPALWDVLERHRTPIYFNLRYKRDFGPVPVGRGPYNEALPIFKEAKKRGVPIRVWLVVPPADGYFAHEGNAAIQKEASIAARAWAADKHVDIAASSSTSSRRSRW
jgi:hypothetical protein